MTSKTKKEHTVGVRVSAEVFAWVRKIAKREGITPCAVIRRELLTKIREQKEGVVA